MPLMHSLKNKVFGSIWMPILAGSFLIVLMLAVHAVVQNRPVNEIREEIPDFPRMENVQNVVHNVAEQFGLAEHLRKRESETGRIWTLSVPRNMPMVSVYQRLNTALKPVDAKILEGNSDPATGNIDLFIGYEDSSYLKIELRHLREERIAGKIVLIIDDFGDRWDTTRKAFFRLGADITATVIPGLKRTKEVAKAIHDLGFEVFIHMPMEPENAVSRQYTCMIKAGDSDQRIRKLVQQASDELPMAAGLNNHMGSKATSHPETMRSVLRVMDEKRLIFIDSRTSAHSVAYSLARESGLRTGKRDVFLDVVADRQNIINSLWNLAAQAARKGTAIGIGHTSKITLEVLKEEIPKLQARGYEFVRVSRAVY